MGKYSNRSDAYHLGNAQQFVKQYKDSKGSDEMSLRILGRDQLKLILSRTKELTQTLFNLSIEYDEKLQESNAKADEIYKIASNDKLEENQKKKTLTSKANELNASLQTAVDLLAEIGELAQNIADQANKTR